jgi:Rrf2 family iron-sulfur cluster assembly transcriptional regulator
MRNAPSAPLGRPDLTQTAEHALRAALYLGRSDRTRLVSAGEVASALGTPPNYTAKTLRHLTRKGLLRSVRGPHGGFALRVEPSELTLARLLDAVDEPTERPAVCLLGDRLCDGARPCGAHRRWLEVQSRANEMMQRTTLADLLVDDH